MEVFKIIQNSRVAINILMIKIKEDIKSDDALRYTQAELNIANIMRSLEPRH